MKSEYIPSEQMRLETDFKGQTPESIKKPVKGRKPAKKNVKSVIKLRPVSKVNVKEVQDKNTDIVSSSEYF